MKVSDTSCCAEVATTATPLQDSVALPECEDGFSRSFSTAIQLCFEVLKSAVCELQSRNPWLALELMDTSRFKPTARIRRPCTLVIILSSIVAACATEQGSCSVVPPEDNSNVRSGSEEPLLV